MGKYIDSYNVFDNDLTSDHYPIEVNLGFEFISIKKKDNIQTSTLGKLTGKNLRIV